MSSLEQQLKELLLPKDIEQARLSKRFHPQASVILLGVATCSTIRPFVYSLFHQDPNEAVLLHHPNNQIRKLANPKLLDNTRSWPYTQHKFLTHQRLGHENRSALHGFDRSERMCVLCWLSGSYSIGNQKLVFCPHRLPKTQTDPANRNIRNSQKRQIRVLSALLAISFSLPFFLPNQLLHHFRIEPLPRIDHGDRHTKDVVRQLQPWIDRRLKQGDDDHDYWDDQLQSVKMSPRTSAEGSRVQPVLHGETIFRLLPNSGQESNKPEDQSIDNIYNNIKEDIHKFFLPALPVFANLPAGDLPARLSCDQVEIWCRRR